MTPRNTQGGKSHYEMGLESAHLCTAKNPPMFHGAHPVKREVKTRLISSGARLTERSKNVILVYTEMRAPVLECRERPHQPGRLAAIPREPKGRAARSGTDGWESMGAEPGHCYPAF